MAKPSRLSPEMAHRLKKMPHSVNDVFGDIVGSSPEVPAPRPATPPAPAPVTQAPAPAPTPMPAPEVKPAVQIEASATVGQGAPAPAPKPRSSHALRVRAPKKRTEDMPLGLVRMPFNFRLDQLQKLEMLKAKIFEETGEPIDKSSLMREALELLFKQYKDMFVDGGPSVQETEAA